MTRDQLHSEEHGRTTVVYVGSDYDSLNEDSLGEVRNFLLACADSNETTNLVVDLSNTRFIGSSFIEVLFRAWNRTKRKGGHFALSSLQPYPAEVIRVSKLDGIWPLYPSAEEAIQSLAAMESPAR